MTQEYKYGELEDWGDVDVQSGAGYMKLTEGDNVVRIISKPFQFSVCWIKDAQGVPRKVRSALKSNCPLIKRGEKLQKRWYLGVIDRRSGGARILEVSSQIMGGLKDLALDDDWGSPLHYDVNIKRMAPGSQPLYRPIAKPKKPLTQEEAMLAERFNSDTDFVKMTQPPTAEEVSERLAAIEGGQSSNQGGQGRSGGGGKPAVDSSLFSYDDEKL